jgi:hypothetical protein
MALAFENVLQVNTGGASAAVSSTPITVSLTGATSDGSTLIVAFEGASSQRATAAPSGWVQVIGSGTVGGISCFRRGPAQGLIAGESSWNFTPASATANPLIWVVMEIAGVDSSSPVDVTATGTDSVTTGTAISSVTPQTTTYDGLVVSLHASYVTTGGVPTTWSGHTGGFVEQAEATGNDGVDAVSLSVSVLPVQALGTYGATATNSSTLSATNQGSSISFVLNGSGARKQPNVQIFAGFEWGTAAGLSTGTAGNLIFDSFGGTPAIITTGPRTGSYCLELSAAAAAEYVQWSGTTSLGTSTAVGVARFSIMFPSALPSADLDLFNFATVSGTTTTNQAATLRYRSASQKLGVQARVPVDAVTGTEQLSATTVQADTWYSIDIRLDGSNTSGAANAVYYADWRINDVDQTTASVTRTGGSGSVVGVGGITLGWLAASTGTVRYDDVVYSRIYGHYPLGDMRVYPLAVDAAVTPTVSGTVGNFALITNNATGATLTSGTLANARDAVDEIPPTIGATADGMCQITAAAADYVQFAMATRDGPANSEIVRAVRMYAAGWGAGSPAAATIGFRGWNGTAETTLLAAADPTFTNSTTTPGWVAKMYRPTGGWTQTQLDALAFRVGFSSDATPDIGIHSIMAEVAVRTGQTRTLFGDAASAAVDPDSAGVINVTVTAPNPGTGDTTLYYEVNGSPTTVPITAGTTVTEVIDAPDAPTVNYIALYPPPEPDPVE